LFSLPGIHRSRQGKQFFDARRRCTQTIEVIRKSSAERPAYEE
jgi:uncharacterized protein YegP (UPF0339 family)